MARFHGVPLVPLKDKNAMYNTLAAQRCEYFFQFMSVNGLVWSSRPHTLVRSVTSREGQQSPEAIEHVYRVMGYVYAVHNTVSGVDEDVGSIVESYMRSSTGAMLR